MLCRDGSKAMRGSVVDVEVRSDVDGSRGRPPDSLVEGSGGGRIIYRAASHKIDHGRVVDWRHRNVG